MLNDFIIDESDDTVKIVRHYQRSVRLDSDLGRQDALEGYVLTATSREAISVIARQIAGSNQRAFTWTGPFGGGKSSLALVLAAALSPDPALRKAPRAILSDIPNFQEAFPADKGEWLVVPVVGRRVGIKAELSKALRKSLGIEHSGTNAPESLIADLAAEAEKSDRGGVLIVVDEMGKLLEASAAGGDDVHFFQDLAEVAARCSGKLVIIGILHQAFRQYASRLGIEAREEWAKVQGRFSDVSFVATGDEVVELIGRAIDCKKKHPNSKHVSEAIGAAISGRRPAVGTAIGELLDKCWPLHPITAALLGPASRRQFGQNERSVFGFLTSLEPFGFQDFLREWDGVTPYGPDRFWDYLRTNLEQAILASPDGHRWAQAVEAVERASAKGAMSSEIVLAKSLALIDMFRSASGLAAESEVLHTVVIDNVGVLEESLERLAAWRVALFRKHVGAWTIFEGSDFDIDQAISKARATFVSADLKSLTAIANLTPIVAKRHYAESGSFRWLGVSMHSLQDVERLTQEYKPNAGEFGRLALVLPDRNVNVDEAKRVLDGLQSRSHAPLILGVPSNHELISDLGSELLSLRLVFEGSPELEGDTVARREVAARLSAIKGALEEALRASLLNAEWLVDGGFIQIPNLSSMASDLAAQIYPDAPKVWSELVNRDAPSANSVKARRDLMHRMVSGASYENLQIEGFPAERGLYETLLSSTRLHIGDPKSGWAICAPQPQDPRNIYPMWNEALKMVSDTRAEPLNVKDLYNLWESAPYGLKAGLMPVFALAFILCHADTVAVYRDGVFEPNFTDVDVDEMLQDPSRFSLRWVPITGERKRSLKAIAATTERFGFKPPSTTPLEVAKSLVALAYSAPTWTRRTQQLSSETRAVRDALLKASDPHRLLFMDLPDVLKASPHDLADRLASPLSELLSAYTEMVHRLDRRLAQAIDAQGDDDPDLRDRALAVKNGSGELRLRTFAARLTERDGSLKGAEGILSLAQSKPPAEWSDLDVQMAGVNLAELALEFRRTESLLDIQGMNPSREVFSVVISSRGDSKLLTRDFEIASRDQPAVHDAANKIVDLLKASGLQGDLLFAALAHASQGVAVEGGLEDA
ncbi:MAG: ATP-binding protein [Pseudomonas kermanshahensis]|uniref:ATP-binding protein n=1 Tax=Pseudomonas kermanshahensis TaxID=2745482 RepID=UPI003D0B2BE0